MRTVVKSSIHIQGAVEGAEEHNSRENFSYSVVFFDEKNEYKNNSKQAHQIFRPELNKRKQAYFNQVGQSLQVNTLTKLSGIINLHQHHTIENLKPIVSYLEDKLDTIVYQIVIHRDEGKLVHKLSKKELYSGKTFFLNPKTRKYYHDKDSFYEIDLQEYTIVKNYHSHIEMIGIDRKGKSIKRNRLHRHFLRELQTFVADTLKMPRGKQTQSYSKEQMKEIQELTDPLECFASRYDYRKAFNASAKSLGIYIDKTARKDTGPFKEHGATVQDLKEQNFALRRDLEYENFKLEEDLESVQYEYQLTKDSYQLLETKNSSLEDENSYLMYDIYDLRQGFQQIRRSLDSFHGVIYLEEGMTLEKFEVKEIDGVVSYVDNLILLTNQKNKLEKKNNAKEINLIAELKELRPLRRRLYEAEENVSYARKRAQEFEGVEEVLEEILEVIASDYEPVSLKEDFKHLLLHITKYISQVNDLESENQELKVTNALSVKEQRKTSKIPQEVEEEVNNGFRP